MDRSTLEGKPVGDLREIAGSLQLTGFARLRKAELIDLIMGEVTDGPSQPSLDDSVDDSVDDSPDARSDNNTDAPRQARDELIARRRQRSLGLDAGADDSTDASDDADSASDSADASDDGSFDDRDTSDDDRDRDRPGRTRARATAGDRDRRTEVGDHDRRHDGDDRDRRHDGDDRDRRTDDADDDDPDGRGRGRNRNRRNRGGQGEHADLEVRAGVLDLLPEGYGFLRTTGYVAGPRDVYVSQSYVRRFNLRRGDLLGGPVRFNKGNDKFPALARLETCEGEQVENEHDPKLRDRPDFDELTPVFPDERLLAVDDGTPTVIRVLDAVAPVGRGQRGLLIAPREAGTTTVLRDLAREVERSAPEAHLMVVLIDERPEEVTELERACDGEVIASTFDQQPEDHAAVADLAIERAKRLVERGLDVVVLLDSLTSLGRAHNTAAGAVAGALDPATLHAAKRFFGAARKVEEAGSLTVIAAIRASTGIDADDVVLQEFAGTGNMEVRLLPADAQHVAPAIDVTRSGTRRQERLLDERELAGARAMRSAIAGMAARDAAELVADRLSSTTDGVATFAG